jgi:4-amino-4-deoxy-L-arabinose transferase-like glycosyltransferase
VESDAWVPSLATPHPLIEPEVTNTIAASNRPAPTRWNLRSVGVILLAWIILQFSGIFSPGLLDDVDSIYIEIAREMMRRHDFVTPYIDGIRFFDKPPLTYWMAAGSMSVFGVHDWAARLPLALAVLALLFSVYALGNRFFAAVSHADAADRGAFYSALALATAIGPYLYTRFFIPDILIALWMTLGIHLFLIALERIELLAPQSQVPHLRDSFVVAEVGSASTKAGAPSIAASSRWIGFQAKHEPSSFPSPLLPCLGFATVMALNILTKGLIGAVFPIGFVLLYLVISRRLHLLHRFHLAASTAVFLVIAAPWHILVALTNPAIALPAGLGLPARGGWAWFYLYNEHIARFLSKRIPHDYGQTPVWLFFLYTCIWIMPWTTFLPSAIAAQVRTLRSRASAAPRECEAALSLLLWAGIILGFFSISARQEYYALPALPAFALMAGGFLSRADDRCADQANLANLSALRWSSWFLTPIATLSAIVCGYFAIMAPHVAAGVTLSDLLANDRALYNLSLGHLFDLTGNAMGLFRRPLAAVTAGMLMLGLGSTLLRRRGHSYAATLTLAGSMVVLLLAAHTGLTRFYPILGSKDLATSINQVYKPGDLILIDSEVTYGSTLIFYTGHQVHVVDGHFNGLWYGSFWPDAPQVFDDEVSLRKLWSSPTRVFLLTYQRDYRQHDLAPFGATHALAVSGGKTILTNH